MTTPVFIQAVPWEQARLKQAHANASLLHARIVLDTARDPFATWRATLAAIVATTAPDEGALFLEDDVTLTTDFRTKAEDVIDQLSDHLIQFFSLKYPPSPSRFAAPPLPSRWMPGSSYLMNQCHYLPPHAASALLAFTEDWHATPVGAKNPTAMDTAISRWLVATHQRYWLHEPSLVQHLPLRSEINPKRSRARQSLSFEP